VSHAPSTFALEIHAVLMFVRVVEVDVSSILMEEAVGVRVGVKISTRH